ncbi:MAG: hypothetical protein F6K39_46340 [Okeania sp. SIO3B3]|nr:hypothetical protein [Okeania sp. SIO3B3]
MEICLFDVEVAWDDLPGLTSTFHLFAPSAEAAEKEAYLMSGHFPLSDGTFRTLEFPDWVKVTPFEIPSKD